MPIYAYKCESCGFSKDVLQKLSDAPLSDCPQCGASSFRKQVTAAGFQLKGSGWYVTDFKGGNAPAAVAPATPGAAESGDKSGAEKSGPDSSAASTSSTASASATASSSSSAPAVTPSASKPSASGESA